MKFRVPPSWSAGLVEAVEVCKDIRLFAWALFVILFPFYVVPSGLPQPAAWLLILLMPQMLAAWDGRFTIDTGLTLRWLARFVGYVFLSNLIWSFVEMEFSINLKQGFLLSPFFYIYNAMLYLTLLVLHKRYGLRFLWVTTRAVLVSLALQVMVSFVLPTRLRAAAGFNEPNQLGYYALVSACILLLCQKRTKLTTAQVTIGIVLASYLALVSASKAALASIGLLAIAIMLGRLRTMIIAGLVLCALIFTSNPFSDAIDRAQHRFEIDQSLDFFEERGYDRIWNNPDYWVLGSGEGAYSRFHDTTLIGSHELHSSMGTLFFCYGAVGLLLFLIFMWMVMRRTRFHAWLVMGPAFAYGMTHQGLRFSLMWVLIGVVVALREADLADRKR